MRLIVPFLFLAATSVAQDLPSRWDELTASDWPKAQEKAAYTCVLPMGILEKHGPHAPMGADLIKVREFSARAAQKEYAVVFPDFYYGQIYEARHQPGTFALPSRVVWDLLDATVDEIGRNGFKKIVIINGHGGNPSLIHYFLQAQLERRRDYVVYYFNASELAPVPPDQVSRVRRSDPGGDLHAGERETSLLLHLTPHLVQQGRATQESGANQKGWSIPNVSTGIWWYAGYPHHYAGQGETGSAEFGALITEHYVAAFAEALRAIKADDKAPALQKEFFDRVDKLGR